MYQTEKHTEEYFVINNTDLIEYKYLMKLKKSNNEL